MRRSVAVLVFGQYGVSPDPLDRKLLTWGLDNAGRHCQYLRHRLKPFDLLGASSSLPSCMRFGFPRILKRISEPLAFCLLHSFFWYLFALCQDAKHTRQVHPGIYLQYRDAKRTWQAHPLRVTVAEPQTFLAIF